MRVGASLPQTATNKVLKRTLVHEKFRHDRVGDDAAVGARAGRDDVYRVLARRRGGAAQALRGRRARAVLGPVTAAVDAVVFDIGGVLVDWDPRHLYRKLFDGDDEAMEHFLATVCTQEWNAHNDRGRPLAEGVALLTAEHPQHAELIEAFATRWPETVAGTIDGTVERAGRAEASTGRRSTR